MTKKVYTGEKTKFVNLVDNVMAQDVSFEYAIDIVLSKSPKGVKCGAIVVYAPNHSHLDLDPLKYSAEMVERLQHETSQETEIIHRDPEYFSEREGRWIPWAISRALKLYDDFGGHARIAIKCPKLRVRETLTAKKVAGGRNDMLNLFKTAWDINRLLDRNFEFDPWSEAVRRGRINAEMSKR
jgi:hypothetical protein